MAKSPPPKPSVYAGALRLEEYETSSDDPWGEQIWVVTLYDQQLSDLSDAAVKWVIAHELGHVASGLPCGSLSIGRLGYTRTSENVYRAITGAERELHEFVADAIARAWGFWEEEQVWVKEQGEEREGGN